MNKNNNRETILAMYVLPDSGCGVVRGQFRRDLLMSLAQAGKIQLLDDEGHAFIHDGPWIPQQDDRVYVAASEREVITAAILQKEVELRAGQVKEKCLIWQRRQEEEMRRKQEQSEQRKARLRQPDPNCPYKTLKAAYADGWVDLGSDQDDDNRLLLKGHVLLRKRDKDQSKTNRKEKLYVYKTTLRTVYGLTPRMIEALEPPDELCVNPHYKSGPPANLYVIERVEAWTDEHKEEVEKARASKVKRSAAAKAVHDKKLAERLKAAEEWIAGLEITVRSPFPKTLLKDAHRCFALRGDESCINENGLHAYCRHRLTNYENLLRQLYHNEFSGYLYPRLRKRVDAVVMAALLEWNRKGSDDGWPG